jgi:hypothetical protein
MATLLRWRRSIFLPIPRENAKQIVRDVQAALSAAYALDVDHRIISVAQLPVDPTTKKGNADDDTPYAECR